MMYILTLQEHAQIVDALENVYGKGKLCDAALAMLKAMRPVAQAAQPAQQDERAVTASVLSGMVQSLESIDKEQWGYHWRKGWNDALRQAMDYAQPAHAHAIDTSPERVEKQAGNVQVPEGWQLVPVKPTQEMLYEAQDQHIMPPRMKRLWKLLLSAAPSTKEDV